MGCGTVYPDDARCGRALHGARHQPRPISDVEDVDLLALNDVAVAPTGRVVVAAVHVWARFGARAGAPSQPRPDRFHLSHTHQETRLVNTDVVWYARTRRAAHIDETSYLVGVLTRHRSVVVDVVFDHRRC